MLRRIEVGGLGGVEAGRENAALTVVLFHGYGADAADLAPLAAELRTATPLRWVFPDAPLSLADMGMGRAWFPIDAARLQQAQLTGKPWDPSGGEPAGLPEAREAAGAFLEALGVPWERLVLGGFSQGAILAADLTLRAPKAPAGLALLSGTLIDAKVWTRLAPARKGLRFFQSHGIADPILSYPLALRLEKLLGEAGLVGRLHSFEGGHCIPPEVLEGLSSFLEDLVPA